MKLSIPRLHRVRSTLDGSAAGNLDPFVPCVPHTARCAITSSREISHDLWFSRLRGRAASGLADAFRTEPLSGTT